MQIAKFAKRLSKRFETHFRVNISIRRVRASIAQIQNVETHQ